MKLLIAVPSIDMVHAEFVQSLVGLIQRLHRDGIEADFKMITGTLVYAAREKLALHAINNNYTDILWLDADMVFDDELLYDLQFAHKSFVSGIARARRYPYVSCLFSDLDYIKRIEEIPSDTFRIAGCGFACVLMKVDILRRVREKYNTCFLPMLDMGEDLAFCKRADSIGVPLWAEPAVKIGHIGNMTIYPDDAEQLRKINLEGRPTE